MTVSLLEILAAARAHVAPLAAESAGYLLLAVTDHVAAAPRAVTAEEVELLPDGSVRLRARRGIMADGGAEQVLRQLLARTLEVASSVGPALRRAAQRPEDTGLPALVRELETALIPVNRAAAKRALSRLHRETERAKSAGKLARLLDAEATPVVAAPVAMAPVVAAPVVAAPVVAAPVVVAPLVQPGAEPVAWLAEIPELSPPVLPVVNVASLPVVAAVTPRMPQQVASPAPELTPEPQVAVGEPAFTRPEPVVQRAKERGNSTPRLGTLVTLQTLPGEENERTERAPAVALEEESFDFSVDVDVDFEIEVELEEPAPDVIEAAVPQPLVDPEPSCMPDVLTAMLELHTGVDADEAPTRIRDVITELRASPIVIAPPPVLLTPTPAPVVLTPAPSSAQSLTPAPVVAAVVTPAPVLVAVVAPVPVAVVTPVPVAVVTPVPVAVVTPVPVAVVTPAPVAVVTPVPVAVVTPVPVAVAPAIAAAAPVLTPAPELVEDGWLTHSSLVGIESAPRIFESERVDPALHEALTWDPGPVVPLPKPAPPSPALTIAEPLPEPSPYAPAVLPSRTSDVSDLLDSFYVSDAAEERDLRSALKGMAGLELTPMPHPYVEEG